MATVIRIDVKRYCDLYLDKITGVYNVCVFDGEDRLLAFGERSGPWYEVVWGEEMVAEGSASVRDVLEKMLALNATARAMLEKVAGVEAYAVRQVLEVQAELLESASTECAVTEVVK